MDIGKNLSNALYGIVSSKFKSVSMGRNINEIDDVDIYFVPVSNPSSLPPYTGMGSYTRLNSKRKFSTEMASCSTESASRGMEAEACLINLH